jgi:hypothetical protein
MALDTAQVQATNPAVTRPKHAKIRLLTRAPLDGRTKARRQFDAIAKGIAGDLGGEDQLSTVQRHLIEAFAGTCIHVHDLNARLLMGEKVDILAHSQAISSLVRVASRLPVGRIPREVESLAQYLQRTHQSSQHDDIDDAEANP